MERSSKLRIKIPKLLPYPIANSSAINFFISPPPSPHKHSPPIFVSLIPSEARRKPNYGSSFDTKEPTSPKVSCFGHVDVKKKKSKSKPKAMVAKGGRKMTPKMGNFEDKKSDKVPTLGTMNKFVSGRGGALSNFDWKSINNPVFESRDHSHKLAVTV